jgi:hypothetical protein
MKPFAGYEAKYQAPGGNAFGKLPAGVYVGKIYGAKADDKCLTLQLDVTEGEHNQYYHKRFEADKDSPYGQKYKGMLRLNIPDGGQYHETHEKIFNSAMGAIELSNPGYKWDWVEAGLKGKAIGFCVREREFIATDGSVSVVNEIFKLVTEEDARNGKLDTPKRKNLKNRPAEASSNGGYMEVNVEDIPF